MLCAAGVCGSLDRSRAPGGVTYAVVPSLKAASYRAKSPLPRLASIGDRVVVAGGSCQTIDFLRLATVRTEEVVLVMERLDDAIRRFVRLFPIEVHERALVDGDLDGVSTMLITIGDIGQEDRAIREARWRGIPVHVADRAALSDFTMLDFLHHSVG